MSGMSGGSMLRTRRKDVNVKPNRRLDRKSSRGMLYENEELRLRTININAEVEKGQSDIKKLKRENEQLRREVGALRGEYDRLERLLKARHQQDNSDPEESGSCCSDCESECCNTQNNVNAAKKETFCCSQDMNETEYIDGVLQEDGGSCSMVANCRKLTVVPEETILRVPYTQQQNLPPCNCQRFIDSPQTSQDYYTAVVTVPMASHLPDTQNIQLTPANVYPKTGLDVLINNNNNAFENFQGFTVAPPIGFIIPPPTNCEPYENDSYQIVPNVDLNEDDIHRIDDFIANKSQKEPNTNNNPQNRNTMEDLLGSFQSMVDSSNLEDSYFICNTKKVIQQLTTVQNTNVETTTTTNACNCKPGSNMSNPDIIIVNSTPENIEKPSYITEKNIELQYDYPKSVIEPENHSRIKFEETKTQDITQTTQTMTEVNSTIMMFGKKKPTKERDKYGRSHSAPAGTLTDEPIYATVQKLPKKLKRLHIKNLENETKYVPPKEDEAPKTQSILKISDPESINEVQKPNGVAPKIKVKLDSFSESSEKNDTNARNSVSNSPVARKKKRFTIHFKRRSNNNNNNKRASDRKQSDTSENVDSKIVEDTKDKSDVNTERLLEQSSSMDLSDANKSKEPSPTFTCKKHKKGRHVSRRDSVNQNQCPLHSNGNRQAHQCEKCSERRKSSGRICEHIKQSCSPEINTSHSERERTNSLSSSAHSGYSLATNKSRKMSSSHQDENIPWCGCWGNSCL